MIRRQPPLIAVTLVALLLALLTGGVSALAAEDFGQPVSGQHVYDRAGLLTPDEVAEIERHAAAVEQAGAPVVVYLREKDASYDVTVADGRALMDAWDIQSAPDARDGVVMFFNLEPGNITHGEFALIAGEKHVKSGALSQRQLDRITDQMLSLLRDGEIAAGITTGLDNVASNLTQGPPPPSAFERVMTDLAGSPLSPLNLIGAALAAAIGFFSLRKWRARPTSPAPVVPTTMLPGDLPPAMAGALARGRIDDAQLEATILDLARRGALEITPAGRKKVQVRLLDRTVLKHRFEEAVWEALEAEASDVGFIPSDRLSHVRSHWEPARDALRLELETRGWYDPVAGMRRGPLYLAGIVAIALGVAAFVASTASGQVWGTVAAGLLGIIGIASLIAGSSIPDTTPAGEAEAAGWRGYLAGIKAAKSDPSIEVNLDEVVPYAVAMHAGGEMDRRLKTASEKGYAPAWLGRTLQPESWDGGFYPYWTAFHASMTPASSGGGTSGSASTGSAASGGSF